MVNEMDILLKNIIFLEANLEKELTIIFIVMFLIVLSVMCLTIIKKAKSKDD